MKFRSDKAGWLVIAGGIALAIYGTFWHPAQEVIIGLCMMFLFFAGLLYFDNRLNQIEHKLDDIKTLLSEHVLDMFVTTGKGGVSPYPPALLGG